MIGLVWAERAYRWKEDRLLAFLQEQFVKDLSDALRICVEGK